MASLVKDSSRVQEGVLGKMRTYGEVVEYLDALTPMEYGEVAYRRMQELDKLFDNVASKIETVLVGGTNGKSSTIHFAAKLLAEEGFKVGITYSSHFLTYNERCVLQGEQIPNKQFAEVVNDVINAAQIAKLQSTAFEILTMAHLLYFKSQAVDVVLVEVGMGGARDITTVCNPIIAAVTRIAEDHTDILGQDLDQVTHEMIGITKQGSWFISAEQSKIRLQKMKDWVEERHGKWAMPIRKLAALPYIFEQLYGRSASLAERIAQIYVEDIKGKFSPFLRGNLLATQRGQRGRPTIEAKRRAELNPIKTLKGFWAEQFNLLRGRFELLDKEKPTILLDNAQNIDALNNVFLGIRLLHYQRSLKGFTLILGLDAHVDTSEVMKLVRYLFKKVNGQVFFVPLPSGKSSCDVEKLVNLARELNVKAKAFTSFAEAFEAACKTVDERSGLVAVCGCASLVSEYWKLKGIKRFN